MRVGKRDGKLWKVDVYVGSDNSLIVKGKRMGLIVVYGMPK